MKTLTLTLLAAISLVAAGANSNRRAPGFSLMDTHFQQHDLQDYLGRVVLLDFMQTTCPVCNSLADTLAEVEKKYGEKIAVLSVVTQPDNFDTAAKFSAAHGARWPIVFDSGQVMMSYLQLKPTGNMNVHFPHLFVIDRYGAIRNDFGGDDAGALTVGSLSAEIDRLLQK
ncbi:MAG TPA: TlpA disulfide reductase family protein [Bryobacteraceae bacterium]|nr:TlpA disulfide reductase family protein [Bryobacteraceae bacterium]